MNKTKTWIFLQDYGGVLALIVAITATLGSLYFSEVAGFVPCTLCWYQRILMYPLTIIALVGIVKQDEYLPFYILPFSLLGMAVSGYHVLIQNGVFGHPAACTAGAPCSLRYVNYLGFITIPLMALTAFTLITVVMIATRRAYSHESWTEEIDTTDEVVTVAATENNPTKFKRLIPFGAVLMLAILLALMALRSNGGTESAPPAANPIEPVTGEALFEQLVLGDAPGCIACHSLEPETVIVGPTMAGIADRTGERVPGQSAGDYLRESIVNPDAYVADGFAAGVMYQDYDAALTAEQIDALVTFLLTLQ